MQFFPILSSSNVSALGGVSLGGAGKSFAKIVSGNAGKANDFLNEFNEQLAEAGVVPLLEETVESGPPRGFRTVKRDVSAKLDDEDLSFILEKLRKNGVDDDALAGVERMLSSGESPTLGAIMAAIGLSGRMTETLTEEESQDLTGALQKLRFTPEETEEIAGMMHDGRGADALRAIRARAREVGEGAQALTGKETMAVMRGLDLSAKTLGKVAALLGSGVSEESAAADAPPLRTLLGPAEEEFASRGAEREKLAAGFTGAVNEALQAKKIRETTAPVADTRGSKKTDRAETLMRDDMTAEANGLGQTGSDKTEDEPQAGAARENQRGRGGMRAETADTAETDASGEPGESGAIREPALAGEPDGDAARLREARNAAREENRDETGETRESGRAGGGKSAAPETGTASADGNGRGDARGGSGGGDGGRSPARDDVSALFEKVEAASGVTASGESASQAAQAMAHPRSQTVSPDAVAESARRREIFSQVEQGVLRQLQDGSRQMTLRLDPAELGQVTVILSVRSGEVRATIRAENPETTALLSEQMQQLKQTLEEQGLKVAQLDVETRLSQDTTKEQFQDMAHLNQEQEMREQARFLQLAKLRREAGTTLAQDMQSKGMREENAASGLHIIA